MWKKVGNLKGNDGKSAYQIWLEKNNGSIYDFLSSLKGEKGKDGIITTIIKEIQVQPLKGDDGLSIEDANVNDDGDLILNRSDGLAINAGHVRGKDGENGSGYYGTGYNSISPKYVNDQIQKLSNVISVRQHGAVGDGVTNDTQAFVDAILAASVLGYSVYIPCGTYIITSDLTVDVSLIGESYLVSIINSTRRLILDTSSGLELRDFSFISSMNTGVSGNAMVTSTISGSKLDINSVRFTYTDAADTAIADINRQTLFINGTNYVSVRNCKLYYGNLEIYNSNYLKIKDNFLDMLLLGNDAIKLSEVSDYFIISGNHIQNTYNDGIDTFTSGAYGVISDNIFQDIGFNGIQAKTTYRFSPYTSGSSDQSTQGTSDNIIISNNIMKNIKMTQATGGADAAGIYCLFLDERFQTISGAADNGAGLIRITTSTAHPYSTGNKVKILAVLGTTEANSIWTVTVINTTTFDLQSSTFTNTFVTSQGYVTYARNISGAINNGSGLIRLTVTAHGLTTGNIVVVESVGGVSAANSTWTVTVIDVDTIDLQDSTFSGTYTSGGSCSLSLTVRNAPTSYIISNNIIDNVNTDLVSGTTCGVFASGGNITMTGNVITNCYKGGSAASYAGSGIVLGKMNNSLSPTMPQNITLTGNISHGQNCGIAINSATFDKVTLTGNNFGYNTKTGDRADIAGFLIGEASLINRLSCTGNIFDSTSRSFLNASNGSYITISQFLGNNFSNRIESTARMATCTFNGNFINGISNFGTDSSSVESGNMIYTNNITSGAGTTSSAVAFDRFTGLIVTGNNITAGREMLAIRGTTTSYVCKDNIGSGQLDYTISNVADNGAGLIRITTSVTNNRANSDWITISSVGGTTEANGTWQITTVDATNFDLVNSTYTNAYTSGGVVNGVLHYVSMSASNIESGAVSGNFSY